MDRQQNQDSSIHSGGTLKLREKVKLVLNSNGPIRMVPKSQWMKDSDVKLCVLCKSKFTFTHRRHHCRMCGGVVCAPCSSRRHPKYNEHRICFRCYSMVMVSDNKLQDAGDAESRLLNAGTRPGDFLVRESASVDGFIALSIKGNKKITHFLIHEKYGKFFLGEEPTRQNGNLFFETIQNLITENKAKYSLHRAMIVPTFEGTTCPGCAATVKPTDEFCDECGRRLQSTKEQIQVYEDADDATYDDEEGATTYEDTSQPATYEGGSVPAAYEGGSQPAAYGGDPQPAAYEGGSQPAAYGGDPQPAAYEGGPQPAAYGGGSQPAAYGGGSQPAAYEGGSAPAAYDGDSQQVAQVPANQVPFIPNAQAAAPQPTAALAPQAPMTAQFCAACGSKRMPNEKFCGSCGIKLN